MNLPFKLIEIAKRTVPERFERPPFWKLCSKLGHIAWCQCGRGIRKITLYVALLAEVNVLV